MLFLGRKHRPRLLRGLLGFSAGVMLAAMVWSLLQPAIDMTGGRWGPAAVGFLLGIVCLLALDSWLTHAERRPDRSGMLSLAVTLHNIPEGMAVGVVFAGWLNGVEEITLMGAFALALGIAIQNFPEGAIISMPLISEGVSKPKAFFYGVLSGIVEPVGVFLTVMAAKNIIPAIPYCLSFAAGAMLYVVVEELIPEMSEGEHSHVGTILFAIGFALMMVLDVALG